MNYIEEIKRQILKLMEGENANIYLYGSYAKGTANFSSDVDVAIEYVTNYNIKKIFDVQEFFEESKIPLTVNIVDLCRTDESFIEEVKSTGIIWKNTRQVLAKKALKKLGELVGKENRTEVERDSLILRFQFCFELLWKCGKDYLQAEHGFICASPKKVIRALREVGNLSDEETADLLRASEDRNLTVHIYNEKKSEEVAADIDKFYFRRMEKLLEVIA